MLYTFLGMRMRFMTELLKEIRSFLTSQLHTSASTFAMHYHGYFCISLWVNMHLHRMITSGATAAACTSEVKSGIQLGRQQQTPPLFA